MLRECEGDSNAGKRDEVGVIAVSVGNEYMGGIHGSGIVSSAADLLGKRVVCGMRGAGGVCMCLAV